MEIPTLVDDVDDMIDVLVRRRLFLGQALLAARAGDDADRVELLVDAAARGQLDRRGAAHHPARPVAGRAERVLHAAGLSGQDPARRPHAAGDDHRLADRGVNRGNLGMAGREGARRPLAVDADLLADAPSASMCSSNLAMLCATS